MRFPLLLMIWFALTVWSSQVGASAMAHCQTHETAAVQAVQNDHTAQTEVQIHVAADYAADQQTNLHDCCDQSPDHQHCSGSCPSCDGCSTAHGAAMPTVWLMKATIAQQKIQYFDDLYLRSQSSAQERPPKN
jgi:hypothetical protein